MGDYLNGNASPVAVFSVLPPESRSDAARTIPAGPMMPGWRITLSLNQGAPFREVVRRETISYVWAAFLAIATLAVVGILAGQFLTRQARMARLKTDLVASVSHELRTPLSSMQLLADALLEEAKFEPVKTREYLTLIAQENRRLSRLVENFLAFSRMEHSRYEFEFAETNVADVVRAAADAVAQRFSGTDVRLEVDISPDLRLFMRIRTHWRQSC